ncbi:hypothetical protein A3F03_01040 [Candidatus Roizmanbacteria bacterium RIFCSPHIGHO2_12_FULL_41_11]|uniref:Response regulatory domain-containing protein n=3 Tax=Candidatus Roizmaniibacteriota TaxID=1752723 RepID=A0A1F7JRW7_9BACT|nr:MAG: hypothetical protein A3F03_01040 [Candidatus Roizmanbacteria bacterium RIFCSPHIGHO2_12_FULL_41_11]OGK52243.1 MAG: hypothetical protein A2966_02480 [Candidatus Roizmanbacteria bacterium RIFCSPLOWO2_01_FULL_41_22]OGK58365.1 MAG: hypothetical protein A3H86_00245 [Candidatus Roizmanbacteria bacterium RIFCSPLOWO2_02_FULL_41_9]
MTINQGKFNKESKLVWIIEDDEGILEVTQIVLKNAGYQTELIQNEKIFHQKIHGRLPNVILLDVLLSGSDGRDIAKILKSDANTKHIPIIMMSADITVGEKAKLAKIEDFIKKPFDIDDLLALINKWQI